MHKATDGEAHLIAARLDSLKPSLAAHDIIFCSGMVSGLTNFDDKLATMIARCPFLVFYDPDFVQYEGSIMRMIEQRPCLASC